MLSPETNFLHASVLGGILMFLKATPKTLIIFQQAFVVLFTLYVYCNLNASQF